MSSQLKPNSLQTCFVLLDKQLSTEQKLDIRLKPEDEFCTQAHRTLGMWIRNNWIRNGNNELLLSLQDLDIHHMDDLSDLILRSYARYLKGEALNLQQIADYYHSYWLAEWEPNKNNYPPGEEIIFGVKLMYQKENNQPGCLHIQADTGTGKYWIYDFNFGWKQITTTQLQRLTGTTLQTRVEMVAAIFKEK